MHARLVCNWKNRNEYISNVNTLTATYKLQSFMILVSGFTILFNPSPSTVGHKGTKLMTEVPLKTSNA